MKLMRIRFVIGVLFLLVFSSVIGQAQVKIEFEESGQSVDEDGYVYVTIELSEASLLDISVPYRISTASTATLDTDYEIPEDDEDEDFDNESPILFESGETSKNIVIEVLNDIDDEANETIIFELLADEDGIAELGDVTTHTVLLIDDDPVYVYIDDHSNEYSEKDNISIPIRLNSEADEDIEVSFEISYANGATAADLDLDDSAFSESPVTISAESTYGSIYLSVFNDSITDRNDGGADEETIIVTLTGAQLVDSETSIDFDSEPFEATIVDNDPLIVEFDYDEDEIEFPIEIDEYFSFSALVTLIDIVDDEEESSTASDSIFVPITISGTASNGEDDDDDYEADTDDIEISSGSISESISFILNNDDDIEEDETIVVTLGQPYYEDGGDVVLGDKNTMTFKIVDNDPITLTFADIYSKDDEEAAEDEDDDIEDVVYVASAGSIIAEEAQTKTIPIYLSSISANNVEFTLNLNEGLTTATRYDSDIDEDEQDWDFSLTNPSMNNDESSVDVVIRAGSQYAAVYVTLEDDDETPTIFGEAPSDDVEGDETISFTISDLNTDESYVEFGEQTSYTLTVRDFPDIDISNILTGMSPDPDFVVNEELPYVEATGLFDAHYNMALTSPINVNDYPGYGSVKFQFRPTNYDASNQSASTNDMLVQSPDDPDEGDEYHYYVVPPYQLRFSSYTELNYLKEGEEPVDDEYNEATADIIESIYSYLHPVYFPRLNDFQADLTDNRYDLNDDPLDFTFSFFSRGYFNMPIDRIDPLVNPERFKAYLTTSTPSVSLSTGTVLSVAEMLPQSDGSIILAINTGNASAIQVQYLDPGEEWTPVQPTSLATGTGSVLFWHDQGLPFTRTHPKNVQFRLYRAISL